MLARTLTPNPEPTQASSSATLRLLAPNPNSLTPDCLGQLERGFFEESDFAHAVAE